MARMQGEMTPDEFETALSLALQGQIVTEYGAGAELAEMLLSLATRPHDASLIAAARDAFRLQSSPH